MKTLDDVLLQLRQMSQTTREQGEYFERLIVRVLKISPLFADQFRNVWLWYDWPGRNGQIDAGIDIVAERRETGALVAIQCKFYGEGQYIEKGELNSFFAALGQEPFREGIVFSTSDNWSKQAEQLLVSPSKPVQRVRVQDLRDCGIDWSSVVITDPEASVHKAGLKKLRSHQREAVDSVIDRFGFHDRGQLIMACGTGKTFTSLKLMEELVPTGGTVLFLVPSISLLQQTLFEWKREAERSLRCFAVCSDVSVGKKQSDDNEIRPYDLVIPATTDAARLIEGLRYFPAKDLTVVFSTYQSISRVSQTQKVAGDLLPEFDLVICDEAHRTTGVAANVDERSEFMRVHDNDAIRAKKRLYMTATPRIYTSDSQQKAVENEYLLASMDDPETYGPVFHRLGFGQAVEEDLLADYKVLILTVSETMLQRTIDIDSAENLELSLDDAVKIIGCWNGLAKRDDPSDDRDEFKDDSAPMRRAVAFSRSIKDSKHIRDFFPKVTNEFIDALGETDQTRIEIEHVDGKDSVLRRSQMLDWLKADVPEDENVCRILTNARCLSEGVDVPALDAVLFLNPRDSVVDVVQSVGRVMRKADGKKYGYIILPIPIPASKSASEALSDNTSYKVVWQVLQALRAHDDRFNAMVNKLDLNQRKDEQIKVIGVGGGKSRNIDDTVKDDLVQLTIDPTLFEQWRTAIYARIVDKVGDRRYWDNWAGDIAKIAETHVARMRSLLTAEHSGPALGFDRFLGSLREQINPSVTRDDAIEMLAQHLITRPVFEALFASEAFTDQNPVSQAMQQMLDALGEHTLEEERATLEKFYRSVHERAAGIDNAEGRQRVITELYDKFFRNAFPKMAERLGIVYTPVEVVDYLLHSADYVMRQHFGKGLTDEGVHILDPFTGTGTFITRLLQSGLIRPEDAARKFDHELHANEVVLLAYYIAAVNIETVFQEAFGGEYRSFTGVVWTDTFQMTENEQVLEVEGAQFRITEFDETVNSERAIRQVKSPIRVIVGNPPYSVGQESANDNNQNVSYKQLDARIRGTFAASSTGTNKRNLYDSYVRAIRWASDRIGDAGVISFVTNAGFIDGNAMDGIRANIVEEFSSIWVLNARGNQRTSGELSRQEGGKLFGSGSRAPIALTILVKDPGHCGASRLHYRDIGDYLSRERKLEIIREAADLRGIEWTVIAPNENHDWINQRDRTFETFAALGDRHNDKPALFNHYGNGVVTNRDAWLYNYSSGKLLTTVDRLVEVFNDHANAYAESDEIREKSRNGDYSWVDGDQSKIKWSRGLRERVGRVGHQIASPDRVQTSLYRPFNKQFIYLDSVFTELRGRTPRMFQKDRPYNRAIYVTGTSAGRPASALMIDVIPNLHLLDSGQAFPLHWFEENPDPIDRPLAEVNSLYTSDVEEYRLHDGVTNLVWEQYRHVYDEPTITKEDIFYYVYGILHSPEYRSRFGADLKKMLPRIPLAGEFWAFSRAGRELGELHVGYESVEPWPVAESRTEIPLGFDGQMLNKQALFRVNKMRFGKQGKTEDQSVIIYNQYISLSGIPLDAYDYVVNGKSALGWIMERYAISTDKESGIVNDPNDWSEDPRYIIDLLKRIVRVSIETNRIVASLPPLNERDVTFPKTDQVAMILDPS
ncbi:MAG TPA: type ISP restriction/modification enzyme [Thermomicrobiales bacterium]|jgi:predicted helicase|nr:type ISP restriction/modification enzyme [Thermomicrobiales bacterium]